MSEIFFDWNEEDFDVRRSQINIYCVLERNDDTDRIEDSLYLGCLYRGKFRPSHGDRFGLSPNELDEILNTLNEAF